jgi:hypothetical protein
MDKKLAIPNPRKQKEHYNDLVILYKRNSAPKTNFNYFSNRILSSSRPLL